MMYIFQKDDSKYRAWAAALTTLGIETAAVEGSPLGAPIRLIRLLAQGKPIHGYVFRYLNDYPSLWKTLGRLLTEWCVIALTRVVGGSVLWVAHNVDQESSCNHKALSELRRRMIARAAKVVFVTDPLLENEAKKRLKQARSLSWLCFGKPAELAPNKETLRVKDEIDTLRRRLERRHAGKKVYVGLCVSSASEKCLHFLTVCRFVEVRAMEGSVVGVIVVGPVAKIDDVRFQAASTQMSGHEQIALIGESIPVREMYLADHIDFFYRALSDRSVSYSLYVAAAVRKPMITEEDTFLAEMVRHYNLGGVTNGKNPVGPHWLEECLERWNPEAADRFLARRSWDIAAEQFKLATQAD